MGIGTSSYAWYVNFVLQRFRIAPYFQVIIKGSDVNHGKPHPEVYITTAQKLGVMRSKCLVLEDAPNGVIAAKTAEMLCYAVPGPYLNKTAVACADQVFPSLVHVESHLGRFVFFGFDKKTIIGM